MSCPEEIVWRGFLDDDDLRERAEPLANSGYGKYLLEPLAEDAETSAKRLELVSP